jgi:hypothetical protein
VKKAHLTPHVHRAVVLEHRTALAGDIGDGVVSVSSTRLTVVGAGGARSLGKPV